MTMEDKLRRLDGLISKRMDIKIADCEDAVEIINEIFTANNDVNWLSEYLFKASGKVAGSFISAQYLKFDDAMKTVIIKRIASGINGNASVFVTGCCVLTAVIETDPSGTDFITILRKLLLFSQDKETRAYNENKAKSFKNYVLNKSKKRFFTLDFSSMTKWEKELLYGFVLSSLKDTKPDYVIEWSEKYLDVGVVAQEQKIETIPMSAIGQKVIEKPAASKMPDNASMPDLVKSIEVASAEIQKLYNNAFVKNNAFKSLEDELSRKSKETETQKNELEEHKKSLSVLNAQIQSLESQIAKKSSEIEDLTGRLKNFSNAGEFSKNQEIERLKNNIGRAVRLEYSDYNEIKKDTFSTDNYEALKLMLDNIFKALRKNDIDFE